MATAEKHRVTVVMELLNSKVNHKDYMCDRTPWGVELCKSIGSERFKLLYDIYHMQIMEGDVIRTLKATPPTSATTTPPATRAATNSTAGPAGAQLPADHARDQGDRLQGLRRPGVHPQARSTHLAARGGEIVRGVVPTMLKFLTSTTDHTDDTDADFIRDIRVIRGPN
jgi:hypothetical protein